MVLKVLGLNVLLSGCKALTFSLSCVEFRLHNILFMIYGADEPARGEGLCWLLPMLTLAHISPAEGDLGCCCGCSVCLPPITVQKR